MRWFLVFVACSIAWGCQEAVSPDSSGGTTTGSGAESETEGGSSSESSGGGEANGTTAGGGGDVGTTGAEPTPDAGTQADGTSTSPEGPGAGLAAPEEWSTALEAAFVDAEITVDGSEEDAYDEASPLRFADPAGVSDNIVEVRALWNLDALFLSYEVADASIAADPDADPWKNDGIEFFVDTANDGGETLGEDDYHVVLSTEGNLRVTRGSDTGTGQSVVDGADAIEHALATGSEGYRFELRIPWDTLGTDASASRAFGLLLGNNDRDAEPEERVHQFVFDEVSPFAQPSKFGTLELLDGPEPEEEEDDLGSPPAGAVDLCNNGLSSGDEIGPVIEQHHGDGETLLVCKGTYKLSSSFSVSGSNWKIVAAEGATLEVDGTPLIRLGGTNWQFSGFVFEQSGGSNVEVLPNGQDWTFSHIAWKGQHPGGRYLLVPWVTARGSTGTVEHVYMGDGQADGTKSGAVWVNANANHEGDLYFRNVHIAQFVDNAIYSTGVPTQGHGGLTHVVDSYLHANTISNVRVGGLRGTAEVRGNVFLLDGTNPPCGVGCSSPGSTNTRAVWAWYGPVEVTDCDFQVDSGSTFATTDGGSFTRSNNRFGSDADMTPPQGVPMSADWVFQNPPGYP